MTRGLKRYHESKQTHFITFSCYRRLRHLNTPTLRDLFRSSLEQTRFRYEMRIFGYVVMPEHVHILVSEPERETLATAIQSLKLSGAKLAKRPTETDGSSRFWQKRYYDFNVKDHEQFVEKLRYIHRNPVKRGLVEKPEEWEWSSFRHYATGVPDLVEIESEWTAKRRLEVLPEKSPR
ncbi:MAG: hypothetical protein JWO20_673 [Candidatus Angelobacter sp.]|nr:hypothetical protein [Candidatus Angelobacter sp.]